MGPHYRAFRCDACHASFWEQNGHRVAPPPRWIGRHILLPVLLQSTIVLAARPTGIASLRAPIALNKEPKAIVVVARNERIGRRLARYEATLRLIAQHCDK